MADVVFRVHFADGVKLDIPAPSARAAGESAEAGRAGKITKIKRIKEGAVHA